MKNGKMTRYVVLLSFLIMGCARPTLIMSHPDAVPFTITKQISLESTAEVYNAQYLTDSVIKGLTPPLSVQIKAEDKSSWTITNKALEASWVALWFIDWGQTLRIARNPDKYSESNPILGRHPSVGWVNTYFAICLIGHPAISFVLDRPYRTIWQIVFIPGELYAVIENNRAGLGLNVSF